MKTGLTKKQKTPDIYYDAKDLLAEVYTHDTNLKKRLRKYAAKSTAMTIIEICWKNRQAICPAVA